MMLLICINRIQATFEAQLKPIDHVCFFIADFEENREDIYPTFDEDEYDDDYL